MPETATKERPIRVQLQRTKGWRMPPNTKSVTRATRWGNPFKPYMAATVDATKLGARGVCGREFRYIVVDCGSVKNCVAWYRVYAMGLIQMHKRSGDDWLAPLRGMNLACYCRLDQPCHADVLLELANPKASE